METLYVNCCLVSVSRLLTVDLSEVGDHDLHQPGEVDIVLPAPLLPGKLVVKDHGPAVSYLLSAVRAVGDLQLRHPLLYLQYGDTEDPLGRSNDISPLQISPRE